MGFKYMTLELASIRCLPVHDQYVDMDCEVVRICSKGNRIRYLLRYPDGVTLPIIWDEHAQGMTERGKQLRNSRSM